MSRATYQGGATLDPAPARIEADATFHEMHLEVAAPVYSFLEQAAIKQRTTVADVLRKCIGLYMIATEAVSEGKTVAILSPDGQTETILSGF